MIALLDFYNLLEDFRLSQPILRPMNNFESRFNIGDRAALRLPGTESDDYSVVEIVAVTFTESKVLYDAKIVNDDGTLDAYPLRGIDSAYFPG